MNLNGTLINGINAKSVEHYGNLSILTFRQRDLLESFLMGNIKLGSKK